MGPSRKVSDEQTAHIVKLYVEGASANLIAVNLGIPVTTIRRTLGRAGVVMRSDTRVRLPVAEKAVVAGICASGASIEQAATLHGVSTQTVTRILRQHNVSLLMGRRPSCELDHTAFDEITPESAYWMGFLFADGCVSYDPKGSPKVRTNLGVVDRAHVEKLRAFLGSTHAISINPPGRASLGGPTASFGARSKRLSAALLARGMVTKRTRVPSPELIASRDFWRGSVDGDGGLGVSSNYPYIFLTGQMTAISSFQEFLTQNKLVSLTPRRTKSGVFAVQTSGSTAFDIIERLYEGAAVALHRKNHRAQLILRGDLDQVLLYEDTDRCDLEGV